MFLLGFGTGDVDFSRVHVGDKLWKTSDPELERHLQRSYQGEEPKFQRPISIAVHGSAGQPLTVIARDETGHVVLLDSAMPLVKAEKQPLRAERLRQHLGRLGGTPFRLAGLECHLEGDLLLPISELNHLRRRWVAEMLDRRARPLRWTFHPSPPSLESATTVRRVEVLASDSAGAEGAPPSGAIDSPRAWGQSGGGSARVPPDPGAPRLIVLARNLAQLDAALDCGLETIYCDFSSDMRN